MGRVLIAAATFLAVSAVTLANVAGSAEPQRTQQTGAQPAAAPAVQVYSNPS